MITKVQAKVVSVSERSKYYPEKGTYIVSGLSIVENQQGISGSLEVKENLCLGDFYSVVINTNQLASAPIISETEKDALYAEV
jgi:hypothetical protein